MGEGWQYADGMKKKRRVRGRAVAIRMTGEEKAEIQGKAKGAGKTFSEWVIERSLDGAKVGRG